MCSSVSFVKGDDTSTPHQCNHLGYNLVRLWNVYQNQASCGQIEVFSWQSCIGGVSLPDLNVVYSSLQKKLSSELDGMIAEFDSNDRTRRTDAIRQQFEAPPEGHRRSRLPGIGVRVRADQRAGPIPQRVPQPAVAGVAVPQSCGPENIGSRVPSFPAVKLGRILARSQQLQTPRAESLGEPPAGPLCANGNTVQVCTWIRRLVVLHQPGSGQMVRKPGVK
jgi:hypothetical protein